MNALRTIRNNWKKSVFAAGLFGYGVSTLKTNIEIKNYMDKLSNEVVCTTQNFAGSPQNILVVLNPIANNKKAENLFKKYCEPILHLAGYSVEVLRTSYIGHAKSYIEDIKTLPDVIVVAGGDGTKSEVITGLLRRQGNNVCPINFIPLGKGDKKEGKFFSLSKNHELEYVIALCNALMPLLKNQYKYENVIQYDVLSSENKDEKENKLKPIFGLNGFSWGLLKDIDQKKDKYWYFGPLKHQFAAFLRSFSGSNWNLETDYIYTPPCSGCSNCYSRKESSKPSGFFLSRLVASKSSSQEDVQKVIKNDDCATNLHGSIKSNQINISLNQNKENFAQLESKFINCLQPGWNFVKEIPKITNKTVEPNVIVKSRTIKLFPSENTPNMFYSIDGEEYEPRPIKVSIVPNAIKVFC